MQIKKLWGIEMNEDMKDIQKLAEKRGYSIKRFEEYSKTEDEVLKKFCLFIFEKNGN